MNDDFVLDLESNPHPDLRDKALHYRRVARTVTTIPELPGDVVIAIGWLFYREAMLDATGLPAPQIDGWLDHHDDPNIASTIETSLPDPGVRRR